MKKIILAALALFSLNVAAQEQNFKLIGDFSNLKSADSVFLCRIDKKDLVPFSRAKVEDGKFTLTGYIPYEHDYVTMVTTSAKDTLYGKLFVEKRRIAYKGQFTPYPIYEVEGSKYAHKMYASHKDLEYLELRKKVMEIEASETTDEEKLELQKMQQELAGYILRVDKDWFEEDHPNHQIFKLYQYDPKKEFEVFKEQAELVIQRYPDHPLTMGIGFALEYYVKEKKKEAEGTLRKSRVGTRFTDVIAIDVEGNEHKFSEILKENKLVLLDFWASWCGPCRAEFPHLRIAYDKYKEKGFEIYAVSLDDSRNKWLQALEEEKTSWINTIDLEAWKSQPVKDYEISGIPYNILVNEKGEILGESLRGEKLEVLLEKYLL